MSPFSCLSPANRAPTISRGLCRVIPDAGDLIAFANRLNAMTMLDAHIRRIVTSPLEPIADVLAALGMGANALTLGGFALGLIAAALIADSAFVRAISGVCTE